MSTMPIWTMDLALMAARAASANPAVQLTFATRGDKNRFLDQMKADWVFSCGNPPIDWDRPFHLNGVKITLAVQEGARHAVG